MKNWSIILALALLAGSCYYDVEEELYPSGNCNTANVKFSATILPILQEQCYACHTNATKSLGGGISLEGYTNLKPYVTNGKFLGSIKHQSGYVPMPDNSPKLSSCRISQIEKWIADGANND